MLKVESMVEEYEMALRHRLDLRRDDAEKRLGEKTLGFRERLLANELRDLTDTESHIREEERQIIGLNFWISMGITLAVVLLAVLAGDRLAALSADLSRFITHNLSWFYVLVTSGLLIFLLLLAFGRFGGIVLGYPGNKPEFSTISWFSMLFSAGMGVGILFYGSAEPMSHYLNPPLADAASREAARGAVAFSVFHWGLHAWAIYTVCAAAVAYYGFRKRKKYLISSGIMDVARHQATRKVIRAGTDTISTLAVVFGVSTSLGLGILQISSGVDEVFGLNLNNFPGYLLIITLMTATFLASSATGLDKGIKILSNVNMAVAALLLAFVFLTGPTLFNLKYFVDSIGLYIQHLPEFSFKVEPFRDTYEVWMGDWTISYFTWWIAWAPFVGIFIARISRGRTLRELILGCLLVPTGFGIFWFAVFGGTALNLEHFHNAGIGAEMVEDPANGVFLLFQQLPLPGVTSVIAIILLFTFLVTSADSATFVISMMTSQGDLDPPTKLKLTWGGLLALVALVLVSGGGMEALQASTLLFAFPFALVLILMAYSLHTRLSIQIKKSRL